MNRCHEILLPGACDLAAGRVYGIKIRYESYMGGNIYGGFRRRNTVLPVAKDPSVEDQAYPEIVYGIVEH
jgi:hypothetical protein